jgi:uncharacterized repeat protein (TIGR02543 family)
MINRVMIVLLMMLSLPMPALAVSSIYTYDDLNRLHEVILEDGRRITYEHDEVGNIQSKTGGTGQRQYLIRTTQSGCGTVTPVGSAFTSKQGSDQTINFTPSTGSYLLDVQVDDVSVGSTSSYQLSKISSNHTISAIFSYPDGDVNNDGVVDIADALLALQTSVGLRSATPQIIARADVAPLNASGYPAPDGQVTVADALMILKKAVGLIDWNTVCGSSQQSSAAARVMTEALAVTSNSSVTLIPLGNGSYAIQGTNMDGVSAIKLNIAYDTTTLGAPSVTQGTLVSGAMLLANTTTSHGFISVGIISTNPLSGSGPIAVISFATWNSASTVPLLKGYELSDTNGHLVSTSGDSSNNQNTITVSTGVGGTISPKTSIVNLGGNQAFTITPTTGYSVSDVKVDGVSQGAMPNYTFSNVTANHTINATFAINQYTVAFAAGGPNGILTGAISQAVNYGASATAVTAVPATGYHFVIRTGTGGFLTTTGNPLTVGNVTATQNITANFAINQQYTITPVAGTGGAISPTSALVNYDGNQAFTITPAVGYYIDNVAVDGAYQGAVSSYTFTNVTKNHGISATFAANQYIISFSSGPNGSVTGLASQSVSYNQSTIGHTAMAAPGYHFVNWTGTGGFITTTSNPLTVSNVTAAQSITANFAISQQYTITPVAGTGGAISPTSASVSSGGSQTFTITPAAGYYIGDVSVDGASQGAMSLYTFSNVTANHTINATFIANGSSVLTFRSNGTYTAIGSTSGLAVSMPIGHDSGTTPSYSVTLPPQAMNVVVTCYGGGGSADPGDDGYGGWSGQRVQSSTLTGILGVPLDLFVGQGAPADDQNFAWPDAAYTGNYLTGGSSSIYLHGGAVLKMLAGGGDDAYDDNGGPVTRGPYNTNVLGDFGGTVTGEGGGMGGGTGLPSLPVYGGDGWITITYTSVEIITANAGANGSISPAGDTLVPVGEGQTYTIVPASGYQIADVMVDGVSAGAVTSYTFSNATANHTISASFTATGGSVLTFRPNGAYTAIGSTSGLTVSLPSGHDSGTTPSYSVTLPPQAKNVVVTCYGGGGSADPGDDPEYGGWSG